MIERDPSAVGKGHNIDVQGSAETIMERMGLTAGLRANNTGERGASFINQAGKTVASFPLEPYGLTPTNPNEVLRGDLCGLIHTAAMKQPGVRTVIGKVDPQSVVVDEKNGGNDAVTVKLTDGSTLQGDALIIADGQWSPLRRHLFDASDITFVDKDFFCFYATIPKIESDGDQWWLCPVDKRRMLSTRPDPHGSTRAMLLKMSTDPKEKAALEAVSTRRRNTQRRRRVQY